MRLTRRALPVPIDYVAVIIPWRWCLCRRRGIVRTVGLRRRWLRVVRVLSWMRSGWAGKRVLWGSRCSVWVWLAWLWWRKWLSIGTIQLCLSMLASSVHSMHRNESLRLC